MSRKPSNVKVTNGAVHTPTELARRGFQAYSRRDYPDNLSVLLLFKRNAPDDAPDLLLCWDRKSGTGNRMERSIERPLRHDKGGMTDIAAILRNARAIPTNQVNWRQS